MADDNIQSRSYYIYQKNKSTRLTTTDNPTTNTSTGIFNSISIVYLDLIAFLKTPEDKADLIQTRSEKAKKLITLLMIDLPVMVVLILVLSGFEALGIFELETAKFNLYFLTIPTWPLLILFVFLIPFVEELIFRLYLRYKYNYLLRFLVFATSIGGKEKHEKVRTWANRFWTGKYKVIFYMTAILFGLIHITNYEISIMVLLFMPIIVIPQIVVGLLIGYLRVRHGLFAGFLLHATHNAIFFCIPILFMSGSLKDLAVETDSYKFSIEEPSTPSDPSVMRYFNDSIVITNSSIKSILAEMLVKEDIQIKCSNALFMNASVNLKFVSKLKSDSLASKNEKYYILRKGILNQLSKSYGFKAVHELKNQEIWELHLIDADLLDKSQSDSIFNNRIKVTPGEISWASTSMWHMTKTLTGAYDKFFVNKTGTKKKYAIKLQTKDFNVLKEQLSKEYGLKLIKSEKQIEFTTIEF